MEISKSDLFRQKLQAAQMFGAKPVQTYKMVDGAFFTTVQFVKEDGMILDSVSFAQDQEQLLKEAAAQLESLEKEVQRIKDVIETIEAVE